MCRPKPFDSGSRAGTGIGHVAVSASHATVVPSYWPRRRLGQVAVSVSAKPPYQPSRRTYQPSRRIHAAVSAKSSPRLTRLHSATPPYRPHRRIDHAAAAHPYRPCRSLGHEVVYATTSPRPRRRCWVLAEAVLGAGLGGGGRAEAAVVGPKRRWPRRR
jgi:hypothetical protein